MRNLLKQALTGQSGLVELRYHAKHFRSLHAEKGKVEQASIKRREGIGVRVLEQGTWGFASTSQLDLKSIRAAIDQARSSARSSAAFRKNLIPDLPQVALAVGDLSQPGVDEVLARPLQERADLVLDMAERAQRLSTQVSSSRCTYNEIHNHKAIVTTDGADVEYQLVRPEFRMHVVAERDGELMSASNGMGVTGGWDCLFRTPAEAFTERVTRTAVDLLRAKHPEGGHHTLILSPAVVGLLVHEAIGHTVEADFVQAGSVAADLLGQKVASDMVTLCDSGHSEYEAGAGGTIPVDDEGVLTQRTVVIQNGRLVSYLHNRESAAHFGVSPTGNARAWEYADQPLIRMRNTYLEPGKQTLDEIVSQTESGFLLEGPRGGQADATAEFTFGVTSARRIHNGKIGEMVRGVNVTGNAFDVLKTVDAVSHEFEWDLGAGHCGKGQPAKVDAGGPYIRCQAMLGGQQ